MFGHKIYFIALVISFITLGGCSKSPSEKLAEKFSPVGSLFSFKYDATIPAGEVAKLNGDPVTYKQLTENAPALVGLLERRNEIWMAMAYRWVSENLTKGTDAVNLTFYFKKPNRKFKSIVAEHQFKTNKKVKVSFAKELNEAQGIAKAGDRWIKRSDLPLSYLGYFQNEQRIVSEKIRQLNRIYKTRALFYLARDKKQAVETFINENILTAKIQVSPAMVSEFLAERKIAEAGLNDRMKKQFEDIVMGQERDKRIQAYLDKTLTQKLVHINFVPSVDRLALHEAAGLEFGNKDAKVEIRWFGGFFCDECKKTREHFEALHAKHGTKVKFVAQFAFSPKDRYERTLAEAAACVHEQDAGEVMSFVQKAQELLPPISDRQMNDVVQKVAGIGMDEYTKCFLARKHKDVISKSVDSSLYMGVIHPGVVTVDGFVFQNQDQLKALESTINRQIASASPAGFAGIWYKVVAIFKGWFGA